jgi:hypothetical protein
MTPFCLSLFAFPRVERAVLAQARSVSGAQRRAHHAHATQSCLDRGFQGLVYRFELIAEPVGDIVFDGLYHLSLIKKPLPEH